MIVINYRHLSIGWQAIISPLLMKPFWLVYGNLITLHFNNCNQPTVHELSTMSCVSILGAPTWRVFIKWEKLPAIHYAWQSGPDLCMEVILTFLFNLHIIADDVRWWIDWLFNKFVLIARGISFHVSLEWSIFTQLEQFAVCISHQKFPLLLILRLKSGGDHHNDKLISRGLKAFGLFNPFRVRS